MKLNYVPQVALGRFQNPDNRMHASYVYSKWTYFHFLIHVGDIR